MNLNLLFLGSIYIFSISTVNAINIFDKNFKPKNVERLSDLCQQQYGALSSMGLITLFDASTKIPEGLLLANYYHLGDFEECYKLKEETALGTIYGKYCLSTFPIFDLLTNGNSAEMQDLFNLSNISSTSNTKKSSSLEEVIHEGIHLAYCIPSGCSAEDISSTLFGLMLFSEDYCSSKISEPELSPAATATISVLGIFLGIVAVSTAFEVAAYYLNIGVPHGLLIAFSAFSNGKKLIKSSTNPDQLLCINGIKAISMMWVVMLHVYWIAKIGPMGNLGDVVEYNDDTKNMFMYGATVAVDSFLAVGGLVTVYTFLKGVKQGENFNILKYYVHRYIRLTPVLAVMVLINSTLVEYLGNGPLWHNLYGTLAKPCREYWWSALLYIQNYAHDSMSCVEQSWYLSVDFQLFLLSPLILLPLKWKPKMALWLLGILTVAGIIVPFVIGYIYELPAYNLNAPPDKEYDMMFLYYKQTYGRFGPYVIGMGTGYLIHKMKNSNSTVYLHPIEYLPAWVIVIAGLSACVFSYHDATPYDRLSHSLSMAFLRNAWAFCVCAVVFLCVAGYGGVINWFLSLPVFQFLSKLSYTMYLVHYTVISLRYAALTHVFDFSNQYMLWSFWGDFMYTLAISVIICLTFEIPMITIEKYLFSWCPRQNIKKKPSTA